MLWAAGEGRLAAEDGCGGLWEVAGRCCVTVKGCPGEALVKCRASITLPLIWHTHQFLTPSSPGNGGSALRPAASRLAAGPDQRWVNGAARVLRKAFSLLWQVEKLFKL